LKATGARSNSLILGHAVGVGIAFLPVVGIPARFVLQDIPPVIVYGTAFLLGAAVGALVGAVRGVRV
jgi:hypothetical protein